MQALRGLTWGHRRAIDPLAAAARWFEARNPGCRIEWDVQPLGGFEHGLDGALADRFDMIVFDHPFCGDIFRDGLFQPVPLDLAAADFVGPSLESYRYAGGLWGVPIDGATQAAVCRPDLLARHGTVPATWNEVVQLGARVRAQGQWLGLALANPHGFLVLAALCANLGRPQATEQGATMFDPATLRTAFDAMQAIAPFLHPDCLRWNAIDLHEAMGARDDIVYCPLAYAYLTHAEADQRAPLRFADFAGPGAVAQAGTVLGGTGLGITRSCRAPDLAWAFAGTCGSAEVQALFAAHHGQPARIEPWQDAAVDARFGHAFSATRRTVDAAWIRPRFAGATRLQHTLGAAFVALWQQGRDADIVDLERAAQSWTP